MYEETVLETEVQTDPTTQQATSPDETEVAATGDWTVAPETSPVVVLDTTEESTSVPTYYLETEETAPETIETVASSVAPDDSVVEQLQQQTTLQGYICGFLLFFTIVVLCTYVYKFFRLFF